MPTTSNFGWTTPADTDLVKDGAAAIRTLGNGIDTSFLDLKGGTTGQVLSKTSNTDLDFTWVAQDDSNAIQNALLTTTGDTIYASAPSTPARLALGTAGQVLKVNSGATAPEWGSVGVDSWSAIQTSAFALDSVPYAINFLGSTFLCGGGNAALVTSTNGTTWTARTFGGTATIKCFAYNGSIYVAGNSSNIRSATDPTSTWTSRTTNIFGNDVKQIIWDGAKFVAVGGSGGSGNRISTSTDGITWTARLTSIYNYNDVAYDGVGNYLAVSGDGTDRVLTSSTNGTSWTETTVSSAGFATGVIWNGTDFIVVGTDSDESRIRIYTVTTAGVVTEKGILTTGNETAGDFTNGAVIKYLDNKYYIFTQQGIYVGGSDFRFTLLSSGFQNRSFNYPQSLVLEGGFYYGLGNDGTLMRGTGVGV